MRLFDLNWFYQTNRSRHIIRRPKYLLFFCFESLRYSNLKAIPQIRQIHKVLVRLRGARTVLFRKLVKVHMCKFSFCVFGDYVHCKLFEGLYHSKFIYSEQFLWLKRAQFHPAYLHRWASPFSPQENE
jgi:hypothetical protein